MRLFVALDLPADLRLPDPPGPPWRVVPAWKRHVTLVFVGEADRPPALPGPPPRAPLIAAGAVLLPPRRPRVLAVRLEDPTGAHTAFQRTLAKALGRTEDRPWLPHVTIGRARERVGARALPEVAELAFAPPSMTLYESRGGRYVALERVPARS